MSRYNLALKQGKIEAFKKLSEFSEKGLIIELKYIKKTRSNDQNRALHLYFNHIATALLEIGIDYHYTDFMTGETMCIPMTGELVKEWLWKPLQKEMFKIESTTKLTTQMINEILEVLSLWLGEKNKSVTFPNKMDLLIKQMNKTEIK